MSELPTLVPVSELERRLGLAIGSLSGADLDRANAALEDASALVRSATGARLVTADGEPEAPPAVATVTVQAALRAYNNPSSLNSESVEGYSWQAQITGVYLTKSEREICVTAVRLSSTGGWIGIGSVGTPSASPAPFPALFAPGVRW